jgi:hypothetical protein
VAQIQFLEKDTIGTKPIEHAGPSFDVTPGPYEPEHY